MEPLNIAAQVPEHLTACSAGIVFSEGSTLFAYTGRRPENLGTGDRPAYPG